MRLGEEIVGVHAGGQHRGDGACALIGLDSGSQYDKVGVDVHLLACKQVACLYAQLLSVLRDLTNHTFNIMYAVLLNCAAVELVKVLTGGTHVDVEYV